MNYAIVDVKGGGVFLKRRDGASHDRPLHDKMLTEVDPNSPYGNHRVSLVQKTAVRGMLMRLCGMTSSVKSFENASDGSEAREILNIVDDMVSRSRIVATTEPHIQNVFFDAFNDEGDRKDDPNSNLALIDWQVAHPIVRFLRDELTNVLQETTVLGCYEAIQDAAKRREFVEYTCDPFEGVPPELLEKSRLAYKFVEQVRNKGQSDGKVFKPFLSIAKACVQRLATDEKYFELSKSAGTQVSNFTPNAPKTKPWVDVSQIRKVRGLPEFVAKIDWQLVVPKLTNVELCYLERGPKCAAWAENGVARLRIEYSAEAIDGMSDNPHITVRDMNLAGFKIRTTQDEKEARAAETKERQGKNAKEKKAKARAVAKS